MKLPFVFLSSLLIAASCPAASIVWISDQFVVPTAASDNEGATTGVFGSGAGPYADQGFITLLTSAGHTVTRFNPHNTNPLTPAEIAQLNTFDLLIIGRGIASGSFDSAAETSPWNTAITKPLMVTNTYISRASRLGWFTGSTQPDVLTNPLTFLNLGAPVSAYLTEGVAMTGSTMTNSINHPITYSNNETETRGISVIDEQPVAGGTEIATTNNGLSTFIAAWPAGTVLAGTSLNQVLSGYRMQFLAGNRESALAGGANNNISNAGFENLTAEGEGMFLRAVNVAANNGAIPEPGVATLLGLAVVGLLRRRRG